LGSVDPLPPLVFGRLPCFRADFPRVRPPPPPLRLFFADFLTPLVIYVRDPFFRDFPLAPFLMDFSWRNLIPWRIFFSNFFHDLTNHLKCFSLSRPPDSPFFSFFWRVLSCLGFFFFFFFFFGFFLASWGGPLSVLLLLPFELLSFGALSITSYRSVEVLPFPRLLFL